jgi:Helix-turn-helix domain
VTDRPTQTTEFISARVAGKRLNLSTATIRKQCESGQLHAWRLIEGGEWRIDPSSVTKQKEHRARAYTIKEACAILECTESHVRKLIYRGLLIAYHHKESGRLEWQIRIASLNQFILTRLNDGGIAPEIIARKKKLLRDEHDPTHDPKPITPY